MSKAQDQIDINELVNIVPEKVEVKDREQAVARSLKGPVAIIAGAIAVMFTLFQLYTGVFGAFPDLIQRSIHIGFAMVLAFCLYSATNRSPKDRFSVVDFIGMVLAIVVCAHAAINYDRIMMNPGLSSTWDLVLGIVATLLVIEITRRILSWILPAIGFLTILYAFFGPYLPDLFAHRGFSLEYIIETLYMSTAGIWGTVTGVSATILSGFLIFGSILFYTGGGEIFVDLSKAIAGRSYGGPAKVSCISSALFGRVFLIDGITSLGRRSRLDFLASKWTDDATPR